MASIICLLCIVLDVSTEVSMSSKAGPKLVCSQGNTNASQVLRVPANWAN